MSRDLGKGHRLQARILCFLGEKGPATMNALDRAIHHGVHGYKATWLAMRSLREKEMIVKVDEKEYRGNRYPTYGLSISGVLSALDSGANPSGVEKTVGERSRPGLERDFVSFVCSLKDSLGEERWKDFDRQHLLWAVFVSFYEKRIPLESITEIIRRGVGGTAGLGFIEDHRQEGRQLWFYLPDAIAFPVAQDDTSEAKSENMKNDNLRDSQAESKRFSRNQGPAERKRGANNQRSERTCAVADGGNSPP